MYGHPRGQGGEYEPEDPILAARNRAYRKPDSDSLITVSELLELFGNKKNPFMAKAILWIASIVAAIVFSVFFIGLLLAHFAGAKDIAAKALLLCAGFWIGFIPIGIVFAIGALLSNILIWFANLIHRCLPKPAVPQKKSLSDWEREPVDYREFWR